MVIARCSLRAAVKDHHQRRRSDRCGRYIDPCLQIARIGAKLLKRREIAFTSVGRQNTSTWAGGQSLREVFAEIVDAKLLTTLRI